MEAISRYLYKTFDLRPGEIKRALLLQLNIFLLITVILILKTSTNALFLSQIGVSQLPFVFVLIAVSATFFSFIYSRALDTRKLSSVIKGTYWITITLLIFIGVLLRANFLVELTLYIFFIVVSLFAVLSASQFWIMVNIVFNIREAKRLFGFIGSGAIAGGIFGGYLASGLSALTSTENLIFLCVLLILSCVPITGYLWKRYGVNQDDPILIKRKPKIFENKPLQLIRGSKQLTLISIVVGLGVVVAKLVDYQFSDFATRNYDDPEELAIFFGFWFSTMNLISLFIQLFITKRIVGTLGVGYSLFVLPFTLLFPAVILLFLPQLWVAVFLKLNEGSLKQSINKAGVELLMLPIPLMVKKQTKTFIDVFVDSIATGLGGLLLILLTVTLEKPSILVNVLIILLLVVWGITVMSIRKEYINSIKQKIFPKKDKIKKDLELNNESVISGLIKVLENGKDQEILYVLRKLKEFNHNSFVLPLIELLKHVNPEIQSEALRRLYFYKGIGINEQVRDLLKSTNEETVIASFEYLLEHSEGDLNNLANTFLSHENRRLKLLALFSIAFETRDNLKLSNSLELEKHIEQGIAALSGISDEKQHNFEYAILLKSAGIGMFIQFYDWISESIEHSNDSISCAAMEAAGFTVDATFIPQLLSQTNNNNRKDIAIRALVNYEGYLLTNFESFFNLESVENFKGAITGILEQIPSQKSVDLLIWIATQGELNIRLMALKTLIRMKSNHSFLIFNKKKVVGMILNEARNYSDLITILHIQNERLNKSPEHVIDARNSLIDLLERRLDANIERIFYLLGIRYSPDDILPLYENLSSETNPNHDDTLEFLENYLDPMLKRVIIPLVESTVLDNTIEESIHRLRINEKSQYEGFKIALEGNDQKLRLAILYLIQQLNEDKYKQLASVYLKDANLKIRTFAEKAVGN